MIQSSPANSHQVSVAPLSREALGQLLAVDSAKVFTFGTRAIRERPLFKLKPALMMAVFSVALGAAAQILPAIVSYTTHQGTTSTTDVTGHSLRNTAGRGDLLDNQGLIRSLTNNGSTSLGLISPALAAISDPVKSPLLDQLTATAVPEDLKGTDLTSFLSSHGAPFAALATTIEAVRATPYWDGGGLNIGIGYCITKRIQIYGADVVRQDLSDAEIEDADIAILMGANKQAQRKVQVSQKSSLALLFKLQSTYQNIVRENLGQGTFERLTQNERVSLEWLAYNTGEGFGKFKKLIGAIQEGKSHKAVEHLTPYYMDNGVSTANKRAGNFLMAAFASERGFQTVIEHPEKIEGAADPVVAADPTWPNTHSKERGVPVTIARLQHLRAMRATQAVHNPEVLPRRGAPRRS